MLKIENESVSNIARAIYSARNAMNSWDKSDSDLEKDIVGFNDLALAKRLRNAGTDHRKFMRMITVTADIIAPLYWYKEYDTYKVGTVANSCSTMHKIAAKEFTLEDFSHEHLTRRSEERLEDMVDTLNFYRNLYLNGGTDSVSDSDQKDYEPKDKEVWWQLIQLLPSSYNQRRTIMLNYEVLTNIYHARKNHKLDEWITFCNWAETLPYAKELIIGEEK